MSARHRSIHAMLDEVCRHVEECGLHSPDAAGHHMGEGRYSLTVEGYTIDYTPFESFGQHFRKLRFWHGNKWKVYASRPEDKKEWNCIPHGDEALVKGLCDMVINDET